MEDEFVISGPLELFGFGLGDFKVLARGGMCMHTLLHPHPDASHAFAF